MNDMSESVVRASESVIRADEHAPIETAGELLKKIQQLPQPLLGYTFFGGKR